MNSDAYPHRELMLSADTDAPFCTILIEHDANPDALAFDSMRDAILAQTHVLFLAQDTASLALFAAAFRHLASTL